jgi:FtsZ-binding cell division protein ZapB
MEKKEFKQKAKNGIDDIFVKIDELEAKKDLLEDEVKEKYNERIEDLKSKKYDLQEKYNWLIESADEKWEETKIGFTKAYDSFKEGLTEIATYFKK